MAWFEKSFGTLYPLIYRHRSREAAEPEAAFAIEALRLRPGERVLDLASGEGRHLVALRSRGLVAVGVDLSEPLVRSARAAGLPVVRGDMRAIPFGRHFDAVVSFFTSFGYFETDDENLGVLGEVAGCLRPGGRFLIDLPNRAAVEANLVPRSEQDLEGYHIEEERALDGDRVVKRIHLVGEDHEEEFVENVRLYTPEEIRDGLAGVGLGMADLYGDFSGAPFGPEADRMVVTARKEAA